MAGFANSFWSSDYAGGLGVLFGKLQQGVLENQQMLTIARMRADAEEAYGSQLNSIGPATDRVQGGFTRDDGATVRKAYEGVRHEMDQAARNHTKIANSIRELVVNPFGRWCDAHEARVTHSHDDLQSRIKLHDKQADAVSKFRSQYYNKCRLVEDLEEEDKLAFQAPDSGSPPAIPVPTVKLSEPDSDQVPVDLGDETYDPEQVAKVLQKMLNTVPQREVKVPILGIYQNVSTGSDITDFIQEHMHGTSVSYAERIGQDMITNGYLRLIGNVGSTFANSSRMNYQWRPKVFRITGIPEKKKGMLDRAETITVDSPTGAVGEYLSGWNPLTQRDPNESPGDRLRREAREADERYKGSVKKLDSLRCNLEEAMFEHLRFMERCELDRLKAIKAVILDFSGAIGNVIPGLQSTVDNMMLFQETVQPAADLRYLLENYRTGQFMPKVQTYENYYNSVDEQTFGVDLEARARSDRKRVPIIITTILTYLDNHYPELEGDEARRGIWLVDVPLPAIHRLRAEINTGKPVPHEIFERYDIPVVAAVLKLYLLELPDSLVSSHVYEIVKTIYSQTAPSTTDSARISVIQSTLGQLRLANIATLDALTTHFTRLIDLTSADDDYVASLSTALSPCILRPRLENSLTITEKFSYRLIRDLFAHKDPIFGELKRASALSSQNSAAGPGGSSSSSRPRAISTDESNRRAHMEERNRAIASRSRASSPAPGARTHRRDKSTGAAAETRFPVATSSPTDSRRSTTNRMSLDVPGAETSSATTTDHSHTDSPSSSSHRLHNGVSANGSSSTTTAIANEPPVDLSSLEGGIVEKRNSLGRRVGARPVGSRPHAGSVTSASGGASELARRSLVGNGLRERGDSLGGESHASATAPSRGVELVDRPMDD